MLDLKLILSNPEDIKAQLQLKNFDVQKIDEIVILGKKRSQYMTQLQKLEAQRNQISKTIGLIKSKNEDITSVLLEVAALKKQIENMKEKERKINILLRDKLLYLPNIPQPDTPIGQSDKDNVVLQEHILGRGRVTGVKPHYDLAVQLDIVDFKRAVKLSGSRFWAYKGMGAKLVRALENFMLDEHIKKGYAEIRPPIIVKSQMLTGTGQLPKFAPDLFQLQNKNHYLIPTAEVPLVNWYHNEILDLSSVKTINLTAFTPCFRAEAGSGGQDTKGLIRAHQFNKVELVKLTTGDRADQEFTKLLADAKHILEKLELPYRELRLCTGDLGFTAQKTVDLEVWIPSEGKYREVSSVSNCGDFQARRAGIRYKKQDGRNYYAHTLNGSGLAIDRLVAAILENYQNEDQSVTIPQALCKYFLVKEIK